MGARGDLSTAVQHSSKKFKSAGEPVESQNCEGAKKRAMTDAKAAEN